MELQIFESQEFGKIRTMIGDSGKILFCGSDAARALGYSDTTNALKQHCRKDGVVFCHLSDSLGRKQLTKFITEGNLYRLILRSKLPSAEQFEKWVVEIVLPAIRKQGVYITPQALNDILSSPNSAAMLFYQLRQMEERAAEMQPKADYYNALVDTSVLTSIRQTAKELNLPEKLFTYLLIEMGFAYRTPNKLFMPYAFMVNLGYAELKEYTNGKHGGVYMLFTPKGRLYLMKRIQQRLAIKNVGDKPERRSNG
jgi:prophage antirepressor-like protein